MRDKKTGMLYENYGSHCSCTGFEGQWQPEETNLTYLNSDNFKLYTGGYDDESESNTKKVKEFIKTLRQCKLKTAD